MPLHGRMQKKGDYQYIIDHVNAKLTAWNKNQLSFVGRVTLYKSVLESLPIYQMTTKKNPKGREKQRAEIPCCWFEESY